MENEVVVDGWLAETPHDYPPTEKKDRFCRLDLSLKPKSKGKAEWIAVSAFGEVADLVEDDLELQKGDLVRISGFLSSWYGRGRCGRTHRFTTVNATDVELLEGSNERPEKHWNDVSIPPLQDDDQDPFFGRPIEEDPS